MIDYPYAPKDPPLYGGIFSHFYHYFKTQKQQPNYFESKLKIKDSIINKLLNLGAKQIFVHNCEYKNNNKKNIKKPEVVLEYKNSLVILLTSSSSYYSDSPIEDEEFCYCKILYSNECEVEEIKSLFEYYEDKSKKNVYLLCKEDGMLVTQKFKIKLPAENEEQIDIELNYGQELSEKKDILVSKLNSNQSGLALFSGPPGTGKSTFIKYLSTQTNRKIIYLPSTSADELTEPGFLTFISDHKNCILLLEDAEKVLRSRELQENHAISNILNLTDGLLGDCLNIFIIATFNTHKDEIDSALLRKGRLVVEHEFKELCAENCNKIFEKLGSSRRTEKPLSLADIYNQDDNFNKKQEKQKIGF